MYFPKSQIKTNLYTNGGEYINSSTKELYKGYYYEVSNGNKYTGNSPEDGPSILLTKPNQNSTDTFKQTNEPNIITTSNYTDPGYYITTPIIRSIPPISITQPTTQDQQLGIFNRYFCKKNNELMYMEISKETYTQLKLNDPKIAWDLYSGQLLLWQITGTKEQVYKANKSNVDIIEKQQKWYGFSQYFKDKYLKYYLEP